MLEWKDYLKNIVPVGELPMECCILVNVPNEDSARVLNTVC